MNSYGLPSVPVVRILMWMCTVRPVYQPGRIVVNRTLPAPLVSWYPRRYFLPVVFSTAMSE